MESKAMPLTLKFGEDPMSRCRKKVKNKESSEEGEANALVEGTQLISSVEVVVCYEVLYW